MNDTLKPAARAQSADLQALAQQGVQRALAARRAGTELSAEQAQAVGGAALGVPIVSTQPTFKIQKVLINGRYNPEEIFNIGALQQRLGY